jgi:hypothetical protein
MERLIIIKTAEAEKLKNVLTENQVDHQVIYNDLLTDKNQNKKDKLREYIKMKSKEDIFSDYGKALKNKELEAEKSLLENDLD